MGRPLDSDYAECKYSVKQAMTVMRVPSRYETSKWMEDHSREALMDFLRREGWGHPQLGVMQFRRIKNPVDGNIYDRLTATVNCVDCPYTLPTALIDKAGDIVVALPPEA